MNWNDWAIRVNKDIHMYLTSFSWITCSNGLSFGVSSTKQDCLIDMLFNGITKQSYWFKMMLLSVSARSLMIWACFKAFWYSVRACVNNFGRSFSAIYYYIYLLKKLIQWLTLMFSLAASLSFTAVSKSPGRRTLFT